MALGISVLRLPSQNMVLHKSEDLLEALRAGVSLNHRISGIGPGGFAQHVCSRFGCLGMFLSGGVRGLGGGWFRV